ncbi:hypothetical protein D3C72_999720 [compost metagenome]
MAQGQGAVVARIDGPDLDIRLAVAQVVLLGQLLAHVAVAGIVVDGRNGQLFILVVVEHGKEMEFADQPRRQILGDEAFILEIAHGKVQALAPVAACHVGEPGAVFVRRVLADAADVAHHGKTQRIRVDAAVIGAVDGRLVDHVGMAFEEFHHEAVAHHAFVVELVQYRVVPEGGPALVHDLGLALRIEILGNLAHDAYHLALPRFQQRRVLLDEVQQVFLGFGRKAGGGLALVVLVLVLVAAGQGAPQLVDLRLHVFFAFFLARIFLGHRQLGRALVAVHAIVLDGVARVEQQFHGIDAMALFALGNVILGKHHIVDDGVRIRPGAEQVIALEEGVMPVRRMRDHQRLHGQAVFLH